MFPGFGKKETTTELFIKDKGQLQSIASMLQASAICPQEAQSAIFNTKPCWCRFFYKGCDITLCTEWKKT